MKKSFLLLVSCGILSIPAIASPGEKACTKKATQPGITKKQVQKKQDQSYKWTSVLSGPFESFIYRILKN